jgi:maltose/maltodextrin transport system substrate-binding protein/arabinogalactan oligomer/maltooligosaccharide transport system substrate-binding protein
MKRFLILLFVLVLLVPVVPNQAKPTPAQAQDDDGGLLIWADATRTPALEPIAAAFSEISGIPVTVQEVGLGDIRANISVAGPAGEGPDIFIAAHDWVGELIVNGAVIPINLGDGASDFTDASISLFTYGDQLYGMPYAVENLAFFRNPELVPDAPATWDDVRTITEDLVSSGASQYGYLIQDNDPYHTYPIVSAFGGYIFGVGEDGNYDPSDVGLDSEGTIAAFEWLQGMAEGGYLAAEVNYDVLHSLFETGDAAMILTGPWALPRIRESGAPYAISNIPEGPAGPGQPFIGGQGFMISAFSENQLLAESFLLDYMADFDPMMALYDADPRPPAFIPLLEALEDPDLAAFQEAGTVGVPQPSIPEMSSVWSAWGSAQEFVIRQEQDAPTALNDAAVSVRALIAGEVTGDTTTDMGESVGLAGTFQAQVGCDGDWDPACQATWMVLGEDDGIWQAAFELEAGDYEYKVALNGAWDENYGAGGEADGANLTFSLTETTNVFFLFDPESHWITDSVNSLIASAPGSYQAGIGCPGDWAPDCLRSWLQDADGDGVYEFTTTALAAGDYEVKVALNQTWDLNYGADAERDGPNIPFSVAADGAAVTFSFDGSSNILSVSVAE